MSDEFLGERKQALEDAFFHKQEAERIAAMRRELAVKKTVAELSEASGISDEPVLEKLVELGVTAETIAALSLVPLIVVAWADGEVQDREREAILEAAKSKGIDKGHRAQELLSAWLQKQPAASLMSAWKGYVEALTQALDDSQVELIKSQVVGLARDVAQSAGGILGIHKVSEKEQQVLAEIASTFER